MKKILVFALCAMTLASCTDKKLDLYCEKDANAFYTDKSEEFDTLSYATGMNYGLVLNISSADFEIDTEAIIATMDKEFSKKTLDDAKKEKNQAWMREFGMKRANPFMIAKQRNSQIETDRPDTLVLPEIFNEDFTREKLVDIMGRNMADAIREQKLPVNLHWVYQAMRDSKKVNTPEQIDVEMSITEEQFSNALRNYFEKELPANNLKRSEAWFKRVATKEGVEVMEIKERRTPVTIYYRVNNAGNNVKPKNGTDTIAVKYSVYSRTGKLLESNQTQIDALNKQIKMVKENKMMPDSMRTKYIANFETEIEKWNVREVALDRFMQADVRDVLKLIGKGGNVTMWMPATSALGYMATRTLPVNEAVVVNVEILDVKPSKNTDPLPINGVKPQSFNTPGKKTAKPMKLSESTKEQSMKPVKVVKATK